jgi:hypothetical protein
MDLHALNQAFHSLVNVLKWVLAQDGALGLVVEFQMNPVHGEVPAGFLGSFDEIATKFGSRGLGWLDLSQGNIGF